MYSTRDLDPFPLESLQFVINETFQNCSIKYGHKKIFFLLVLQPRPPGLSLAPCVHCGHCGGSGSPVPSYCRNA